MYSKHQIKPFKVIANWIAWKSDGKLQLFDFPSSERRKCSLLCDSLTVMARVFLPFTLTSAEICMKSYTFITKERGKQKATEGTGHICMDFHSSPARISGPRINFMYTYLLLQTMKAPWRDLVLGLVSWNRRIQDDPAVCHCPQLLPPRPASPPFLGRWLPSATISVSIGIM